MVGTSIERWTTIGREIFFEIERGWTVTAHVDAWIKVCRSCHGQVRLAVSHFSLVGSVG